MSLEQKFDVGVVNCGGTASYRRRRDREGRQTILNPLSPYAMVQRLHQDLRDRHSFKAYDYLPGVNSSDITGKQRTELAVFLHETVARECRSILIIHGTNTAVETGSALAFTEGTGLTLPVTIVSGQRHHERLGSDSQHNIESGVRINLAALEQDVAEVMVYSGMRGMEALRAVGATKLTDNDLLISGSSNIPPLARITGHDIFFQPHSRLRAQGELMDHFRPKSKAEKVMTIDVKEDFDPRIVEMLVELGHEVIVLRSYETGNLPSNLESPVKKIIERQGTKVVVVPFHSEPSLTHRIPIEDQNALGWGANTAPGNQTISSLNAKLAWMLAYPEVVGDLGGFQKVLDTSLVGELP